MLQQLTLLILSMEAIGQALALFSPAGELVQLSRPLRDALKHPERGADLQRELNAFVDRVRARAHIPRQRQDAVRGALEGAAHIAGVEYQFRGGWVGFRGGWVGDDMFDKGLPAVVVSVDEREWLRTEELRARRGLTPPHSRNARTPVVGRRLGHPQEDPATNDRCADPLPQERLLRIDATHESTHASNADAAIFLRALDTVDQPLAFFCLDGRMMHSNRALQQRMRDSGVEEHLRRELDFFALTLTGLLHLRSIPADRSVEELDVRDVAVGANHVRIKGSYLGLDLFGTGGSILMTLENPPIDPLSTESLRSRFQLTRQEARTARLLVEGRLNGEIAHALSISPHTARHHTERIMRKLSVRSRAEVAAKILQQG